MPFRIFFFVGFNEFFIYQQGTYSGPNYCIKCPKNFYLNTNTNECIKCPKGQYSLEGSLECSIYQSNENTLYSISNMILFY